MSKMNNKGFLLAESLIVSTFVLTVLIFLFVQFRNIMNTNKRSYIYNSVEDIYSLGSIGDYFKTTKKTNDLKNITGAKTYIYGNGVNNDICDDSCRNLAEAADIEYIIYTDSDIATIKKENDLPQDLKEFVKRVSTDKVEGLGRLIAKFNNGHFSTIVLNTESESKAEIRPFNQDESIMGSYKNAYQNKVTTVVFESEINVPQEAIHWELSYPNSENPVIAWLVPNGSNYTLHIGGDGGVAANSINASWLFNEFTALTSVNFNDSFDTSNAKEIYGMFYNCKNLTTIIGLTSLNTSNVTQMGGVFEGCEAIKEIDISTWDTRKATAMHNMFKNCKNLTRIYVSENFDTSNVEKSEDMFLGDVALVGGNGTKHDSNKINKEYARIDGENAGYLTEAATKNIPITNLLFWSEIGNSKNTATIFADKSGQGKNGTLNNFTITDKAADLKFNGSNNFINIGYGNTDFSSGQTMIAYLKMNRIETPKAQEFFGNWEGAGGGLAHNGSKNFTYAVYNSTGKNYPAAISDVFDYDEFHVVIGTYNGTSKAITLYVDGIKQSTTATSNSYTKTAMPFLIGANPNSPATNPVAANVSNITLRAALLYNRALTDEEITNVTNYFINKYKEE